MRNRQLICKWVLERAQGTNIVEREGKHYVEITDYEELRKLFGVLLREVQRIKSEGDLQAARDLVETYGVRLDVELHREVISRYKALNVAPFSGFVNPVFTPIIINNEVVDVKVDYTEMYIEQMLRYSHSYATL